MLYLFGDTRADGDGSMKPLLGGKGANLAEMARIGLPVPPGFTITTEVCTHYYANSRAYPTELPEQVKDGIAFIEKAWASSLGTPTTCRCSCPCAPAPGTRCQA